jgi:hypothetical protein
METGGRDPIMDAIKTGIIGEGEAGCLPFSFEHKRAKKKSHGGSRRF